jgi:hypothetical protein
MCTDSVTSDLKIPCRYTCRRNVKPKTSVMIVINSVDILSGHVTSRPTLQTVRFSDIPWSFINQSAVRISVSTYHTISFSLTSPKCMSTLRTYLKYRMSWFPLTYVATDIRHRSLPYQTWSRSRLLFASSLLNEFPQFPQTTGERVAWNTPHLILSSTFPFLSYSSFHFTIYNV